MNKSIFIGLDFSINKPAMTILYDKKFSFYAWPIKLTKALIELYTAYDVEITSRGLSEMKHGESSKMVLEHTRRSVLLADVIVRRILQFIIDNNALDSWIYIASEGLSFASQGCAMLDLASYKGVLLSLLYTQFNERLQGLFTYAPITIKSTAGCATKKKIADKTEMIKSFVNEKCDMRFKDGLLAGKFMTALKNFIKCVDDIVDSYFVLKTMLKKEGFLK